MSRFKLHTICQPITYLSGHGIIVKIENVPEHRQGMLGEKLYTLMTDFGNVFKLTQQELDNNYKPLYHEQDVVQRFERQQELLNSNFKKYVLEEM